MEIVWSFLHASAVRFICRHSERWTAKLAWLHPLLSDILETKPDVRIRFSCKPCRIFLFFDLWTTLILELCGCGIHQKWKTIGKLLNSLKLISCWSNIQTRTSGPTDLTGRQTCNQLLIWWVWKLIWASKLMIHLDRIDLDR